MIVKANETDIEYNELFIITNKSLKSCVRKAAHTWTKQNSMLGPLARR